MPALAQDLLNAMTDGQADFTLTFRRLGDAAADPPPMPPFAACSRTSPNPSTPGLPRWRERLSREPQDGASRRAAMHAGEPALHSAQSSGRTGADRRGRSARTTAPFEELLTVLAKPYEERPDFEAYAEPAPPDQGVYRTFCGT